MIEAATTEATETLAADIAWVDVAGWRLAYRIWHPAEAMLVTPSPSDRRPSAAHALDVNARGLIVMLHEGLGCVSQWRDLPERLAAHTGRSVLAYDRSGYGRSSPEPATYGADFMEHEATAVLPELLRKLGNSDASGLAGRPDELVLVGHSDGATIALLAAASDAVRPAAVVAIAPHTFLEPVCLREIAALDAQRERLVASLARHHDHPELVFDRWRDVWLSPDFANWDMRDQLATIDAPVLAFQGTDDAYGTAAQITEITDRVPHALGELLTNCGHIVHRDQPNCTLSLTSTFLNTHSP